MKFGLETLLTRNRDLDRIQLETFEPGTDPDYVAYTRGSDLDKDAVEFVLVCWHCARKFKTRISYANLHVSVWNCPYCGKGNETK